MEFNIFENGCKDPEVVVLDTKLPYFCDNVSKVVGNKSSAEIHIVGSKEEFSRLSGQEHRGECSFCAENRVVIFSPAKIESETHHSRDEFYHILYNQLFHVMMKSKM
ncbi:hypothetical protein HOC80_02790 [archaeon]|jgi:hypothetical protein|nr:hypothetical protein [archaeon]MBT4417008.1 hypothetical protein [archaeon]